MKYERYQHICKLNDSETEGILNGTVYIFPKLDGSNCTCYLNDEGELKVGSRNRALTLTEDNQGCMAYVVSQPKFEQYLRKHPNHRLYGEWLCLSGDTIIRKTSAGKNGVNMTLRQMYKYSITPERDRDVSWWQRYGFPSIFSLYQDKDKILPNKIKNIVYTGEKEVYKITTRSGFSIKATKEHPFFTPYGFRPLMELKINDCVGVSRLLNSHRGRSYGKGTGYVLAQQKAYKDSVHQCEQCGAKEQLELHHKDGNAQNNDISNFQILCRQCHSALHHSNGGFFKGFQYDYVFDKIISIEYVGVEDCYDIEMEGTENEANFVANGFIVHNCKNSIKDYEDDAWRKVYIFDVIEEDEEGKARYLSYEEYVPLLEEFDIKYIPLIVKLDHPTYEEVMSHVDDCTYLMKDNKPGEGVVCKSYNYHNVYGRVTWAKVVRSAFKIAHKAKLPMDVDSIEEKITNDLCTPELIEKEYNKILNDNGGKWDSKCIPRFLGIFWHTFITEECFNMVRKYKEPKIDFRLLHKFVIDKIKTVKSELF